MSWPLLTSYVLLWALVLLLAAVVISMVRQIGMLHRRIEPFGARINQPGPEIGEVAPPFEVPDLAGRLTRLAAERGKRTLLVFVSASCTNCKELAPALRSVARSDWTTTETFLVCAGTREATERFVREFHLERLTTLNEGHLQEVYAVQTTPYGVLVDESGTVRTKGIVNSMEQLESLLTAGELEVDSLETYLEGIGEHRHEEVHSGN